MNLFNHPLFQSLSPVFILIGIGYLWARYTSVSSRGIKDLSGLVFYLLVPALLFRTMSEVHLQQLDLKPIAAYFLAALALFCVAVMWLGQKIENVVLALGSVFSNMVMIGIPLVALAYGQAGLVTLLTLVAVHALILLTAGTITLEIIVAKKSQQSTNRFSSLKAMSYKVFKSSVIHPIPLPIICGLAFAQTGLTLPVMVDVPLSFLSKAFGPLALLLVGLSLAQIRLQRLWKPALYVSLTKTVLMPLCVALSAWAFGIQGLPFVVLVVVAGLPIGANVILFSQRYNVVQELTTASMGLSTMMAALTLSIVMVLMTFVPL